VVLAVNQESMAVDETQVRISERLLVLTLTFRKPIISVIMKSDTRNAQRIWLANDTMKPMKLLSFTIEIGVMGRMAGSLR
jgi:hypothetical protein